MADATRKILFHELIEEATKLDMEGLTILRETVDDCLSQKRAEELHEELEQTRAAIRNGDTKYYSNADDFLASLKEG